MSKENVEIWRRIFDGQPTEIIAGSRVDATIDRWAEIWDPEIELDATEAPVLDVNRIYRGADEVRQFWREWLSPWRTLQFDYELIDAGERVVMLMDLNLRGRSTGIELPFGEVAWVSTFRNGLIVHTKLYVSQADALEAAGV